MSVDAPIQHIPLSKHRLLEFLAEKRVPITGEVASIARGARALTVTEMLGRCAAQGLVEREENQRPRNYRITDMGRRLVDSFRSGLDKYKPESTVTVGTKVAPSARRRQV